ncbi:hypothetical protein MTR67_017627 [Solanum verrucosum]|uniref:Sieve element occlusion C-terminal domain-containing protein n=1 Tax=Solanum verrucosum TaxID=315347 RepID=A0AAF0QK64_SOLVR|nr:hypothetical protein MTR67_017627 [Solanum verrucosum]
MNVFDITHVRRYAGTWSFVEYEFSSSGQSAIQLESCLRQKVGEAANFNCAEDLVPLTLVDTYIPTLAFPFTKARETTLWKEQTWNIELLADSIDQNVFIWENGYACTEEKILNGSDHSPQQRRLLQMQLAFH